MAKVEKVDEQGRLVKDSNGFSVYLTDSLATQQLLRTGLNLIKGEWFLNINSGIPLTTEILGANRNISSLSSIYRDVILNTEGVKSIVTFDMVNITSERELNLSFTYEDDWGTETTLTI